MREKCKKHFSELRGASQDILLVGILLLASLLSFGLGFLAGKDSEWSGEVLTESSPLIATTSDSVVASRNGTKYYFPWCAGVERIVSANKIYFASPSDAKAQGYSLAANCQGP